MKVGLDVSMDEAQRLKKTDQRNEGLEGLIFGSDMLAFDYRYITSALLWPSPFLFIAIYALLGALFRYMRSSLHPHLKL